MKGRGGRFSGSGVDDFGAGSGAGSSSSSSSFIAGSGGVGDPVGLDIMA